MKKAMTVRGPVEADELGHILPHEHILMEFPDWGFKPVYPELADKKVTLDILGKLRRDIWSCKDNLILEDVSLMRDEVASFAKNGGGTIVDVTTIGLKRNIKPVIGIAQATGVNIIAGTGYYAKAGHPKEVSGLTAEDIYKWMKKELTEGIEDTRARAGIIGEIGVSSPFAPDEQKVVRAATWAHKDTGAPINIHQSNGTELEKIDAIFKEEGISPEKVVLSHMCSATEEQRLWAADKGYYVEIDSFGNEYYLNAAAGIAVRDPDLLKMVKVLMERGYLKQILISNDIALKMLLKKYGGWGYEHIIRNIKPFMLRNGIPPKAIDTMLYYNPMRMIAYLD